MKKFMILCFLMLGCAGAILKEVKLQSKPETDEKVLQAHNAARVDNGARISLDLIGKDAGKDRRNMPEEVSDGDVHSRCVTWGEPVLYRIDLAAKLPVSQISFICSDYATEQSPKDIEIKLSDGTIINTTLQNIRPKNRNDKQRQVIALEKKELEWVEVKVLSNYHGGPWKEGKSIDWGGIGEIEIITTADLKPYLIVSDYNASAPVYIKGKMPRSDYSNVKVTMPVKIPLGEHPGIYLSRKEILELREKMKTDPRAKPMLEKMLKACDEWVKKEIVMPDPKKPAQMSDRSDDMAGQHGMMTKMAGWLGWAYQLTDNEEYAKKAREILTGYAKLYPNDYKEHQGVHPSDTGKIMAQRLSEAMLMLPLIQSYDMVYNAKCMTNEDKKLIENDLFGIALRFVDYRMWGRKGNAAEEAAARTKANPNWRTDLPKGPRQVVGNWTNFYNAAYIQGGIILKDQNWIDIGMANTRENLHMGIGDDGMWGEGAIGYHLFGRHALIACLEPLARQGVDLYSFETCRFKNLFDAPIKYAYPDGTSPGIHDSGRASVGGDWMAMAFDFAYLRYNDPNYGVFVNECDRQVFQSEGCYFPTVIFEKLPEKPIEGFPSMIFDNLGYAIIRGQDTGGQTYMLMDYGPHGGGHGHPDKLNAVLYADGDELTGEPEGYRYEDPLYDEWMHPTMGHWTVCVDKHSQVATTGKLTAFCDTGKMKVMRGSCDTAFAGVAIDRTLVQMPGYFVDVYKAWGPVKHIYDYPLCFRGTLDLLKGVDEKSLKPMDIPTVKGYNKILITSPVTIDKNWIASWSRDAVTVDPNVKPADSVLPDDRVTHPANLVKVNLIGEPNTTIFAGKVPGGRHQVMVRRENKEAVFVAAINPYKGTDTVKSAEKIEVTGPVPAYGLKITRDDGGIDIIIVRFDQQADGKLAEASKSGDINTNGLVSIIRLDKAGNVIEMGLVGGTNLTVKAGQLTSEKPDIVWQIDGKTVKVE